MGYKAEELEKNRKAGLDKMVVNTECTLLSNSDLVCLYTDLGGMFRIEGGAFDNEVGLVLSFFASNFSLIPIYLRISALSCLSLFSTAEWIEFPSTLASRLTRRCACSSQIFRFSTLKGLNISFSFKTDDLRNV